MTEPTRDRLIVVGQGYVGLPLAVRAVAVGFDVVGFDNDRERIQRLLDGRSYVDDVSDDDLRDARATGHFLPSHQETDLAGFDVAIISVPTPLRDGVPDLSYIEGATLALGPHLRVGGCVILESTTYQGTTEELVVPLLENSSGLQAGRDFYVGYSPERIDPGNRAWTLVNTPKVIAGFDPDSLEAVQRIYGRLVDTVIPVSSTRAAELAKLYENTFRHVNIALVNEVAIFCHGFGIDVWEVVDAAATKPFGFMRFEPGPGVGGHCLPIDPSYLSWQVRRALGQTFRFVEIANDVNEHMPDYVVQRVTEHLNRRRRAVNGSTILLIGLAYKRNSGDARESPAIAVANRLRQLGAHLSAVDPLIDARQVPDGVQLVDLSRKALAAADAVVVLTDHDQLDWALIEEHAERVFDTRNRIRTQGAERL